MAKQQIYEITNGSTLIYQKQNAFNGYSFTIGFRCGAQMDGKYKGLSHLLEHLLFRAPDPKSTNILMDNIVKYTINQNAFTSKDCIAVTFSCVYKNVEQALANLQTLLTRTKFTASQVAQELEIVKHEIKMYKDQDAFEQSSALDFLLTNIENETESIDILGNSRTLNSITPELLSKYVKRYFNLDNLVISVTTNKSLDSVLELCNKYIYSALKRASSPKYIVPLTEPTTFKDVNAFVAVPDEYFQNVSLCLLLRERSSYAEDINLEYAYDVIEEYLMNDMGGILWDVLRTKNQLTYDYELSNLDFGTAKFKAFSVLTNSSKMRKTVRELCNTIRQIGTYGISKSDFEKIKKVLTDIKLATLNKFRSTSAKSNFLDFLAKKPFVDYKKVNDYIEKMTYEQFNEYIMGVYSTANVSFAANGKFDSRKCYSLIEIEKMLGNYSHVEMQADFNAPKIEFTPLPDQNLDKLNDIANEYILQKTSQPKKETKPVISIDDTPIK